MKLTGDDALEKLKERLQYDTEHDAFYIDAADLVVAGPAKKTPCSDEEHGEEGENATVGCKS